MTIALMSSSNSVLRFNRPVVGELACKLLGPIPQSTLKAFHNLVLIPLIRPHLIHLAQSTAKKPSGPATSHLCWTAMLPHAPSFLPNDLHTCQAIPYATVKACHIRHTFRTQKLSTKRRGQTSSAAGLKQPVLLRVRYRC